MKNNKMISGLIFGIILVVVNLIVFVTVKDFTTSRIINIVFLNLSLIISIIIGALEKKSKENAFLNYTKLPMIGFYTLICVIMSALLIAFGKNSSTLSIVLQVILLAVFLIFILMNKAADNSYEANTAVKKVNIDNVKEISKKLEMILQITKDREIYKIVEKAYDNARSLNIKSSDLTSEIDNNIFVCINKIETLASSGQKEELENSVDEIKKLFVQRNNL